MRCDAVTVQPGCCVERTPGVPSRLDVLLLMYSAGSGSPAAARASATLTRFIDGGIYAGKLDPTHNIRLNMGVSCCSFCPGISDYHSGECATNKEKQEAFLARKKKLAEKNKATPTKPTKSIRRGKHGGLREIERKTLKENMN